jgi:ectoine hydroxylase-related dioxygenase (phytanoyl-CoA dioxygenase family)
MRTVDRSSARSRNASSRCALGMHLERSRLERGAADAPTHAGSHAMIRVESSAAERASGVWSPENRGRALAALRTDGVVVLGDVIDRAPLAALKARMDRDSAELLVFCDGNGGNPRDRGHLQQGPPPYAPWVSSQWVANPLIAELLTAVLGREAYCEFYNGNTNCPGSEHQQLHLDAAHPESAIEFGVAQPTSALVVNFVPQDVDERNGAVELWPGTHRIAVPTPVPDAAIVERRAVVGPEPGTLRRGDALLRDSWLWHRGVPNPSAEFRHMVALVYVHGAKPRRRPIAFARDCQALLASAPLAFHATFTDEPIDYLLGPTKRILKALQGPNALRVTRH